MGHASQNLSNNGQQDSMVQNARFGGVVKVTNSKKYFQFGPKKCSKLLSTNFLTFHFVKSFKDETN